MSQAWAVAQHGCGGRDYSLVPRPTSGRHFIAPFPARNRSYEQRIREVEHGSFTSLVFAATGGMGKAAQVTYKRLVSLLATKRDQPYGQTMNTIRCMISFSLLKSQIRCIRGSRSSKGHAIRTPINVIASEGRVPSI